MVGCLKPSFRVYPIKLHISHRKKNSETYTYYSNNKYNVNHNKKQIYSKIKNEKSNQAYHHLSKHIEKTRNQPSVSQLVCQWVTLTLIWIKNWNENGIANKKVEKKKKQNGYAWKILKRFWHKLKEKLRKDRKNENRLVCVCVSWDCVSACCARVWVNRCPLAPYTVYGMMGKRLIMFYKRKKPM